MMIIINTVSKLFLSLQKNNHSFNKLETWQY